MYGSFEFVLRSFDIHVHYQLGSANANGMLFKSGLLNELLLGTTQSKENQISLSY